MLYITDVLTFYYYLRSTYICTYNHINRHCRYLYKSLMLCTLLSYIRLHLICFSAGVGRTGTFITLDAMMERLKERDDLNIFEFVNETRTRRKQMVQTVVSTWQNFIEYVNYIIVNFELHMCYIGVYDVEIFASI